MKGQGQSRASTKNMRYWEKAIRVGNNSGTGKARNLESGASKRKTRTKIHKPAEHWGSKVIQ